MTWQRSLWLQNWETVGAVARFATGLAMGHWLGERFAFATLAVNVLGSLFMGLMAAWFAFEGAPSQHWRLFLTTGMLGGFTTFSTFSLDTALLRRHVGYRRAVQNGW